MKCYRLLIFVIGSAVATAQSGSSTTTTCAQLGSLVRCNSETRPDPMAAFQEEMRRQQESYDRLRSFSPPPTPSTSARGTLREQKAAKWAALRHQIDEAQARTAERRERELHMAEIKLRMAETQKRMDELKAKTDSQKP